MEQQHDFTKGPILPLLLRFALPVLLALLLQAMYGAVDLQVVGRFGTAADISAVSTGGPDHAVHHHCHHRACHGRDRAAGTAHR